MMNKYMGVEPLMYEDETVWIAQTEVARDGNVGLVEIKREWTFGGEPLPNLSFATLATDRDGNIIPCVCVCVSAEI